MYYGYVYPILWTYENHVFLIVRRLHKNHIPHRPQGTEATSECSSRKTSALSVRRESRCCCSFRWGRNPSPSPSRLANICPQSTTAAQTHRDVLKALRGARPLDEAEEELLKEMAERAEQAVAIFGQLRQRGGDEALHEAVHALAMRPGEAHQVVNHLRRAAAAVASALVGRHAAGLRTSFLQLREHLPLVVRIRPGRQFSAHLLGRGRIVGGGVLGGAGEHGRGTVGREKARWHSEEEASARATRDGVLRTSKHRLL